MLSRLSLIAKHCSLVNSFSIGGVVSGVPYKFNGATFRPAIITILTGSVYIDFNRDRIINSSGKSGKALSKPKETQRIVKVDRVALIALVNNHQLGGAFSPAPLNSS
jgi:hypothetical protein